MGGGKRIENVEDVYNLGDKIQVVVREIDDRGKVSLDLAGAEPSPEGESGEEPRPPRERREPRGERSGGERSGGDRGGRDRGPRRSSAGDRGGARSSERAPSAAAPASKPGRKVVSFEDDFESGSRAQLPATSSQDRAVVEAPLVQVGSQVCRCLPDADSAVIACF
jgi:hypothetical protein